METKSTGLGDLEDYLPRIDPGLPKKQRTRAQLLEAAAQLIAQSGTEATTIQGIAARARVTPATFYNHFPSRDAALAALASWVTTRYAERVEASMAGVDDAAVRMMIGNRRFVLLALENRRWALLFLQLGASNPGLYAELRAYPLRDLRLGIKQKRFAVPNEDAALALIDGTINAAMATAATARVPRNYDVAVATVVLRGLGVAADEAAALAKKLLPPLPA
jgi:AcrR family transcriptional regulator